MAIRIHFTCTVAGCDSKHLARGYCNAHYKQFGPFETEPRKSPARDYYKNVVLPYDGDDCLIWPFHRNNMGYAHLRIGGSPRIVSRRVCERIYGMPPTPEHQAAHSCGNGHLGCVSPKHLSWKTPIQNAADKKTHGTFAFGERSSSAKITEDQAKAIKSLGGQEHRRVTAERFGISENHVYYIQTGRSWSHLNGGNDAR